MSVRAAVRRIIERVGFTRERWVPGTLEYELRLLFAKRKFDLLLDIGAHQGEFARAALRSGFQGTLLSFEPNPHAFQVLLEVSRTTPNWHVIPLALSREPGRGDLTVYSVSQLSSLHQPSEWARKNWNFERAAEHSVEISTVADVLRERHANGHKHEMVFLKVDTQGHDAEVLAGAAAVSSQVGALRIELSMIPLYDATESGLGILSTYLDGGFRLQAMIPNARATDERLVPVEFDALLVRSSLPTAT